MLRRPFTLAIFPDLEDSNHTEVEEDEDDLESLGEEFDLFPLFDLYRKGLAAPRPFISEISTLNECLEQWKVDEMRDEAVP